MGDDNFNPPPRLTGPIHSVELSMAVDDIITADPLDPQPFADAKAARLQLPTPHAPDRRLHQSAGARDRGGVARVTADT
jgi:hypothetical protein